MILAYTVRRYELHAVDRQKTVGRDDNNGQESPGAEHTIHGPHVLRELSTAPNFAGAKKHDLLLRYVQLKYRITLDAK